MIDGYADRDFPPDDSLEGGLRAAFGPGTTAAHPRAGSVLTDLRDSGGLVPNVLLRDEPDEGPTGLVHPRSPESVAVASEPGRGGGRYEVAGELARGGIGVVRDVHIHGDLKQHRFIPSRSWAAQRLFGRAGRGGRR